MKGTSTVRGSGRLGCILWLAVLAAIAHVLYIVVPVKVRTSEFYDVMQEEASFASIRPVSQLEREILAKAKDLNLPITAGEPDDQENARNDHDRGSLRDHPGFLQGLADVRLEVRSGRDEAALPGIARLSDACYPILNTGSRRE